MEVKLGQVFGETVTQSYFIDLQGKVKLIYPLYDHFSTVHNKMHQTVELMQKKEKYDIVIS